MIPDPSFPLSREAAKGWVEGWLHEPPPPQALADFLTRWRERGETPQELAGVIDAVMAHHLPLHIPTPMLDSCGTGGSGRDRFNASTVSAMLLASMGVSVAKHGNRGSRSSNGSMDFVEALGFDLLTPLNHLQQIMADHLCVFLFARRFHPLLGNMAPARALITGRSIFNLIGPLCNPSYPQYQLIGCPTHSVADVMAATMALDANRVGWVIVGGDGMDDFSLTHSNTIFQVKNGEISLIPSPPILGQCHLPLVGDSSHNAAAFLRWVDDPLSAPSITEQVILPTAAGLMLTNRASNWNESIDTVRQTILGGIFADWYQRFSQSWGLYEPDNGGLK